MFKIYYYLSYFLIPAISINLLFRISKNKEDSSRYKERIGKTDIDYEFRKKIIWLHAASVGEFKSCDLIIEKYYKNFQILVTTTTKTSAEYVKNYYSDKVIHQYIPFDVPIWCSRFLNFWNPCLVLWIESDIWPNMLRIIKKKKIKCLYVNARVSPKSFNKWKYFKSLYSSSLSTFSRIFAQSPNDLRRIKILSNYKVDYLGNLKLSNIISNENIENIEKIFTIMIVSSHELEEEKVISNINEIIKNKNVKICIAPRHPKRINEILKILKKYNLGYTLESSKDQTIKDVLIIDSFGNLNDYFQKSKIVILGGSFVNKGGHNPIEPAKYGCALISGKYVYNWQNIYEDMVKEKACIMVKDINDLKKRIDELMSNKILIENFKKKALDFSNKKFFEDEILFNEIDMVLN